MITENWAKSTRSNPSGNCLEARWVKSSKSSPSGDNCVEARYDGGVVAVRDSKDRSGPVLTFTRDEWTAFLGGARDGEFDLPA